MGRALHYHFTVYTFTVIPKDLQHYNLTKKLAAGLAGRSIPKDLQHHNLTNKFAAGLVGRSISYALKYLFISFTQIKLSTI